MTHRMNPAQWAAFERLARQYCELRISHAERRNAGRVNETEDACLQRALASIEARLDAMRTGKPRAYRNTRTSAVQWTCKLPDKPESARA